LPDTEKITINLGSVDLGKIDLLVSEGFYSNRADFIRMAVRALLDNRADVLQQVTARRSMVVGAMVLNRANLEKSRAAGEFLDVNVIGTLVLRDDITPDLATDVIQSIQVFGNLSAPDAVKAALAERINQT
jgi:Arc/MetJ-type ribon-helix-helix transcriptional regulator